MPFCGPSCTIPSCASSPVVGFGSPYSLGCGYGGLGYGGLGCGYGGLGCGYSGLGYGYGGLGSGYGGLGYGFGGLGYGYGGLGYGGYGYGNVETSSSLGTLGGVFPSCINQLPASEVVIKPPASIVTIPGPILSSTCEPVAVGGNTPCAVDPFGDGLLGGRYGYGLGGRYGYGLGGRYGYARGPYCFGFPWRRSLLAGSRIYGCPC